MQQFGVKDHINEITNCWHMCGIIIVFAHIAIGKVDSSLLHGATMWDIKVSYVSSAQHEMMIRRYPSNCFCVDLYLREIVLFILVPYLKTLFKWLNYYHTDCG